MEKLPVCPICGSNEQTNYLEVRDYFLSGEVFSIVKCSGCGFKFLNPRPDKSEINKYYGSDEYLSHDTQKADIITILYRAVRRINIQSKYNLVRKNSTGFSLLDIGCGTGEFIQYCEENGYIVTGIEPNQKARGNAVVKKGLPVYDESYLTGEPDSGKDVITLWHVIEHVHNLNERMEQIRRILKDTGTLIMAVPNCSSPDAKEYGSFWAAWDVPRHLYHFDKNSMETLAGKFGFEIKRTIPMKWDAYYVSLLSEKYRKGKKDLWRAFIQGTRSNRIARKENLNYSSLIFILGKKIS